MSIRRFRGIEDMKATASTPRQSLETRIAAAWHRAAVLAPPSLRPRGVLKFRSFEEMCAERDQREAERARLGHPRA